MKAIVVAASLLLAVACGGDDSQCANPSLPHCGLTGHTVVKWQFDHYPEWLFPFDSCVDFMVNKVHVDAKGPDGTVTSISDDCGAGQVTFDGLTEGADYTMYVAPTDFSGGDLISFPASGTITAGSFGADTMTTINVPWTAWIGTFTGTFLFRLTWGGVTCAAAPMPVIKQVLTLTVNGVPVTAMTDTGHHMDGVDSEPCRAFDENFPQSALQVPFGPAQLKVEGRDASDAVLYTHTFDTFVGAGITNPTITYDVPVM